MPTDSDRLRMIEYLIRSRGMPIGVLVAFQISADAGIFEHNLHVDDIATTFVSVYVRPFGRMETCIDAVAADRETAGLLGIREGAPLLVRDQVSPTRTGNVHEFAYAHYRADMVSFRSS